MSQTATPQTSFKRVMLKISGEALMGQQGFGLHPPTVERIADELATGISEFAPAKTEHEQG